jgi:hypothetical protein
LTQVTATIGEIQGRHIRRWHKELLDDGPGPRYAGTASTWATEPSVSRHRWLS